MTNLLVYRYLYFCVEECRARLEPVLAHRRKNGERCEFGVTSAQANRMTTCVYVGPLERMHEFDGSMVVAEWLGGRVDTTTIEAEERRLARTEASLSSHARFRPQRREDFYGLWLPRLETHVQRWRKQQNKAVVLLLVGPSGSGKTCAVESVVPACIERSGRWCKVVSITPADFSDVPVAGAKKKRPSNDEDADEIAAALELDDRMAGSAAGCMTTAYRTIGKHLQNVRSAALPENALLIVFIDNLEDVSGERNGSAVLAGIDAMCRIARPENVALVAACDSWYSKSPVIEKIRKQHASLGFVVHECKVEPPALMAIKARLTTCFPLLSKERRDEIAERADGNFWIALHMAEHESVAVDHFDHRAPCEQILAIVQQTASTLHAKAAELEPPDKKATESLFNAVDRQCTMGYGDEVVYNNYKALVPSVYNSRDDHGLLALDVIAEVGELLSVADVYGEHRRDTHYAGRDGVDVDKQMTTALGVTAPCMALALANAHALPSTGRLDFKCEKPRAYRDALKANAELLVDVQVRIDLLVARGEEGALLLSNDEEWYRRKGRALSRRIQSVEALEHVSALGAQGLQWLRRFGLDDRDAINIVSFSRSLNAPAQTRSKVGAEYKALQKQTPADFLPRGRMSTDVAVMSGSGKRRKTAPAVKTEQKTGGKTKQTKLNWI